VQAQAGGQLVNDLIGRILDVQPERLACLDELRYQRRGGFPDHLAAVINPAPHGSRLRDSVGAQRLACAAAIFLGTQPPRKASAYRSRPTLTSGSKTPDLWLRLRIRRDSNPSLTDPWTVSRVLTTWAYRF